MSLTQVDAIADAASADPGAEAELLERAQHDGVRGLRTACARVKAAACVDQEATYERIRAARSLRHWADPDGTGRIDIRGPVDATARVMAALEPFEHELFEEARVAGRRERPDALAFDALVALAGSPCSSSDTSRAVTTVVRVDYAALVRGANRTRRRVRDRRRWSDPGVGRATPARRLVPQAAPRRRHRRAHAVSHPGRTIPARLRSAIEELHPECDVEGCHVTRHLEIDHNLPIEEGGPTAMWNLDRLCGHHHEHKHRHRVRLVGEPGRMRFVAASEWVPP